MRERLASGKAADENDSDNLVVKEQTIARERLRELEESAEHPLTF